MQGHVFAIVVAIWRRLFSPSSSRLTSFVSFPIPRDNLIPQCIFLRTCFQIMCEMKEYRLKSSLLPSQHDVDDGLNCGFIGIVRNKSISELTWNSCYSSSTNVRRRSTVTCNRNPNSSLSNDSKRHIQHHADHFSPTEQYENRYQQARSSSRRMRGFMLVTSVLLPSSCRGLQLPSLFDNRARPQHPIKHHGLFGVALTQPPPTSQQCAPTSFPLDVTEPSKLNTVSEAPEAIVIPYHYDQHEKQHELEQTLTFCTELPPTTVPESAPSDAWWEDDALETEQATALAEEKRNRMIHARREILFDRTNNQQRPTSNPRTRRQETKAASATKSPTLDATRKTASPLKGAACQVLMGEIRKAAVASASSSSSITKRTPVNDKVNNAEFSKQRAARSSRSIIEYTISDLLDQQMARQGRDLHNEVQHALHGPLRPDGWPMGILGDPSSTAHDRHVHYPMPGTILIHPTPQSDTYQNKDKEGVHDYASSTTVRVATPLDDVDIALLRLSVFSDFSEEVQQQFCSRSCEALANRRLRGATCLVATTSSATASVAGSVDSNDGDDPATAFRSSRPEMVLGTVECSFHEFRNTALGRRRPERSILYITEFAVSPTVRRRGIGARLLKVRCQPMRTIKSLSPHAHRLHVDLICLNKAVDELANLRQVESLYLHVDVTNHAALALYNRAGFKRVTSKDIMFDEFTTSLNLHDGATKGRKHFLLCKHLCEKPTWLPVDGSEFNASARSLVFGFEIPV